MYDLMLLAYQADITRVISFQMAREQSAQTYPWIGVPEADLPYVFPNLGAFPLKDLGFLA